MKNIKKKSKMKNKIDIKIENMIGIWKECFWNDNFCCYKLIPYLCHTGSDPISKDSNTGLIRLLCSFTNIDDEYLLFPRFAMEDREGDIPEDPSTQYMVYTIAF